MKPGTRDCHSEVTIRGSLEQVGALAFDLPAWPRFLPHYRWVRVLAREGDRLTVEMACRRGRIPLRWRSYLWIDRDAGRMRFHHVAGPARGMAVEWRLTDLGGEIRVEIRHDLALEVPLIRSRLGQWVVGELFVQAVAGRTLRALKQAVESGKREANECQQG